MTVTPQRNFYPSRNPTHPSGISTDAGRAAGLSEGPVARRTRGSDPDATTRGSDPGSHDPRRGAVPKSTAPQAGAKNCPKCGDPKPVRHFPLMDDLEARAKRWATRLWCGPCLVTGGHITEARYRGHLDANPLPPKRPTHRRARAETKAREHAYFNDLIDQAANAEDPAAFLRALARAAGHAHLAAGESRARPIRKSDTDWPQSA